MSIVEQLAEPKLTENSLTVLKKRYLQKDEFGNLQETPRELFWRVARATAEAERFYAAEDYAGETQVHKEDIQARVDKWAETFYKHMAECRFMPNTPTLFNTGVKEDSCGSACFVFPLEDSMEGICDCVKWIALVQKEGGGIGVPLDGLRPAGSWISGAKGYSSGPIAFWKALSEMTNAIQQGAKRRGACMAMMWYHHPDILKFLYSKQVLANLTNYNISIKVDDPFMKAVRDNPDAPLITKWGSQNWLMPHSIDQKINDILENGNPVTNHWPGDPILLSVAYQLQDLIPCSPEGGAIEAGELDIKDIWTIGEFWETICLHAWKTGEPGLFFCDRMNDQYALRDVEITIPAEYTTINRERKIPLRIESTNPCGEEPLPPFGSCNLLSINLAKLIREVQEGHPAKEFDFDGLDEIVPVALRFLDNIIDVNHYPVPEVDYVSRQTRDVGLGVMGVADTLYALGIPYNSSDGVAFMSKIAMRIGKAVDLAEEQLADDRGSYPLWPAAGTPVFSKGRRHVKATMNAPTGTISIIAGCSGGVEPMYALTFTRRVMRDGLGEPVEMVEVNPYFKQALLDSGFKDEGGTTVGPLGVDCIIQEIYEGQTADGKVKGQPGSCQWHPDVPEDIKEVFVVAPDISPEFHVRAQAAWQEHFESGVSKTVNLPFEATVQDVRDTYALAYELGCMGVTVYRDGSRGGQPMSTSKKDSKAQVALLPAVTIEPGPPEPQKMRWIMPSVRMKQETPFGTMHVHFVVDPSDRYRVKEIFAQLGRSGHMAAADLEAICRLTSLWLRSAGDWKHILHQLEGIGSALAVPTRDGPINSLPAALHNAISKFIQIKHEHGIEKILTGTVDIDNISLKESGSGASAVNPAVHYQIACPDCGGVTVSKEGCWTCLDQSCGYSRC